MKLLISLLTLILAQSVFAVPNPTHTTLNEPQFVTKYIADNMNEIIESSAELAKKAVPDAHYYLVTKKIEIFPPTCFSEEINQGTSPIATLYMTGALLDCERDIFTKIQYNKWGGKTGQQFFMKPEVRCTLKPTK